MKLYLVTGEPSGDLHAANLVRELKILNNNLTLRAFGGDRLIAEEVDIARNIKDLSFMGFWSVIKNLGLIKSYLNFCKNDILNFNPDAIILVDYPGFNLRIAQFAKNQGIKVFYYIAPKVWAWNKSRLYKLRKYVDELIVIFPFEVDFFRKNKINATYVGNPLLDEVNNSDLQFSYKYNKPIIALLPGSRKQEIKLILPQMMSIVNNFPQYQFIVAGTNLFSRQYYQKFIRKMDVDIVFNETYGLLANAEAALVTSGTATLEAALFNVCQVVCYKTNWITYIVASNLIKIKYLSLVNILANKLVVKELIQSDLNKRNLKFELESILNDKKEIISNYNELKGLLDKKGASRNAARYIIDSI